MNFSRMHDDYLDPDRYFGRPPDDSGKPKIHWQIRRLVRALVGTDGLYGFYRSIYKYTDCGPSIGFCVNGEWIYCDSLAKLGWEPFERISSSRPSLSRKHWHTLADRQFWRDNEVTGFTVSSIVEGSDAEVFGDPVVKPCETQEEFSSLFYRIVEEVNAEASHLWKRDNSMWLVFTNPNLTDGPVYGVWEEGDSHINFPDGDDEVPEAVLSLARRLIDENGWCNNSDNDPIDLCDGWQVASYQVTD